MAVRSISNHDEQLKHIEFETSEDVDVVNSFESMNLRDDLLRGIYAYGNCSFSPLPFQVLRNHQQFNSVR